MTEMIRRWCVSIFCNGENCGYHDQIWHVTDEQGETALELGIRAMREHYLRTGHTRMFIDQMIAYYPDYENMKEIEYKCSAHTNLVPPIPMEDFYTQ